MEPRSTTTYIRLALKQLCRTIPSLPPELQEVYGKHFRNDCQPKYGELKNIFLAIIRQLGHVYFVVDALDECSLDERENLCKFLLSITTDTKQGLVKLFVTSRRESDIEQAFQQKVIPTIEIEAAKVDRDIEVYVKAQIQLRLRNGLNTALKNKILSVLTSKAGGMYVFFDLYYVNDDKVS